MAKIEGAGARSEPGRHPYHIGALSKGLAVLSAFSADRTELSLRDIAKAAGVTQPSALRIAHTLVEADFLVRNRATKGYRLGPKSVSVGLATLGAMSLPEICEPYLHELRDASNETIKLGIPVDEEIVVIARLVSQTYPWTGSFIGMRYPLYVGSLGRAVLAWYPEDEIERILDESKLVRLTPYGLGRDEILKELAAARRRGYYLNDRGVTLEHRSIGAPLLTPAGTPIGSINLSVSAQRYTLAQLEGRFATTVVETAARISATLPPQVQGAGRRPHDLPDASQFPRQPGVR